MLPSIVSHCVAFPYHAAEHNPSLYPRTIASENPFVALNVHMSVFCVVLCCVVCVRRSG